MFKKGTEWLQKQPLTARLSISIIGSIFLGIMLLLYFITSYSMPIIKSQIMDLAENSIQKSAAKLAQNAFEIEQSAITLKNNLHKISADNDELLQMLLNSTAETLVADDKDFSDVWLYVFDPENIKEGILYTDAKIGAKSAFQQTAIQDFYASFPWFKEVPKIEDIYWSEPYVNVENPYKPLVTTCLIPFKFKGADDFNGLIAISMDLTNIQKEVAAYKFYGFGKLLLLSGNGQYVVHPDKNIELKKTIFDLGTEKKLPQLLIAGTNLKKKISGHMEMPSSSVFNDSVIFFYAPIPHWNWSLCLVFSQRKFYEPLQAFQIMVFAAMLLSMILLFALISWICHRAMRPLLQLSSVAEQYGKGDFSAELPTNTTIDEIGTMTKAFYNMKDSLLKYIDFEKKAAVEYQKNISELAIAEQIQLSALPKNFPPHENFSVYAYIQAAKKVGGDFYDFFFIDKKHFAIVIADVSGKGIPAALFMMNAKALLRMIAEREHTLDAVFNQVNHKLCDGNQTGMFVTVFMAVLNVETGILEYISAGHNPPFIKDAAGYHILNTQQNLLLGGLDNVQYKSSQIQLEKSGRLFLYTDGVTEAQNSGGEFYGEQRLSQALNKQLDLPADNLRRLKNNIEEFTAGAEQSDDITMLEIIFFGAAERTADFSAKIKNVTAFLDFLETDLQNKHISADKQRKILIAAEETFSNIAKYAYENAEGVITVQTRCDDGTYFVRFIDSGKPYNPHKAEKPNILLAAEEREIGGLGIFLIKKMTDITKYEYIDNKNFFTFGVHL